MQADVVIPELTEIEALRGRIEGWRQTRPKNRSMPEGLWQEASAAAKRLGSGRVARAALNAGAQLRSAQATGTDERHGL